MAQLSVETFEKATPDLIEALRSAFQEKYDAAKPDFYSEDLARVKTDDLWMKRFLAAQEYNPKLATQMLYETCQWRKEFGTNDLDHTKLNESGLAKGILFIRNQDKWGKKLLIFKAKNHSKNVYPMEDLKKFIVYFFERIEREAKSDQISVIFDMKDTGWNNMDMDFIRYLITLLKQYYPWFVNYLMIYEMPWLLKSAWNIIKGWLPAVFVERVKFVDKKTIGDFIDEDNQLVEWGGKDDYKHAFIPEVRGRSFWADKTPKSPSSACKVNSIHLDSPASPMVNGNPPPDVKPRKVKITGPDGGVERTDIIVSSNDSPTRKSQSQQTPPPPQKPPEDPHYSRAPEHRRLVEVDETLVFSTTGGLTQGTFTIQSLTEATVIVKVKTTSPERYRVRPTIGLIEGEARATINVQVYEGVRLNSLLSDRFQVQASLVPEGFQIESTDGDSDSVGAGGSHGVNFGDLQAQWKEITERPGARIETHRLNCRLDPLMERTNGSVSPVSRAVTLNEDDMQRALALLEQKLTERITTKIGDKLKSLEYLLYVIFILIGLLCILLYFGMPGEFKRPENFCTIADHTHFKEIKDHESCV